MKTFILSLLISVLILVLCGATSAMRITKKSVKEPLRIREFRTTEIRNTEVIDETVDDTFTSNTKQNGVGRRGGRRQGRGGGRGKDRRNGRGRRLSGRLNGGPSFSGLGDLSKDILGEGVNVANIGDPRDMAQQEVDQIDFRGQTRRERVFNRRNGAGRSRQGRKRNGKFGGVTADDTKSLVNKATEGLPNSESIGKDIKKHLPNSGRGSSKEPLSSPTDAINIPEFSNPEIRNGGRRKGGRRGRKQGEIFGSTGFGDSSIVNKATQELPNSGFNDRESGSFFGEGLGVNAAPEEPVFSEFTFPEADNGSKKNGRRRRKNHSEVSSSNDFNDVQSLVDEAIGGQSTSEFIKQEVGDHLPDTGNVVNQEISQGVDIPSTDNIGLSQLNIPDIAGGNPKIGGGQGGVLQNLGIDGLVNEATDGLATSELINNQVQDHVPDTNKLINEEISNGAKVPKTDEINIPAISSLQGASGSNGNPGFFGPLDIENIPISL